MIHPNPYQTCNLFWGTSVLKLITRATWLSNVFMKECASRLVSATSNPLAYAAIGGSCISGERHNYKITKHKITSLLDSDYNTFP